MIYQITIQQQRKPLYSRRFRQFCYLVALQPLKCLHRWLSVSLQKMVRVSSPVQHPYGYQYQSLFCRAWIEILTLKWGSGDQSKPHSHKISFNFTRVCSGSLLERKYHISGGNLAITSERVLSAGQWTWTLPFQVHELIALDEPAQTLHFYFPRIPQ